MYVIFRGVYFGEYEIKKNYKFVFTSYKKNYYKFVLVQLSVTPASFSVLKQ